MNQCTFVYRQNRATNDAGRRCTNMGIYDNNRLCAVHKRRESMMIDVSGEVSDIGCDPKSNFPRIYSPDEEKVWVIEARRRTSPEFNIRCSCLICGIMHRKEELITVKVSELLSKRELLSSSLSYNEIPSEMFSYGDLYCELNGFGD
jgi:hypothetical protein